MGDWKALVESPACTGQQLIPDPCVSRCARVTLLLHGSGISIACLNEHKVGFIIIHNLYWSKNMKGEHMPKVDLTDCVKQIIAINKELEEHDQRQDYHVTWMAQLRDRIEKLEKLQASSSKPQA